MVSIEHETLVEGPLNNLQQSFMTIARPRRNVSNDNRYAFTALARGVWDGRWESQGRRTAPGFGGGGDEDGGGGGRRRNRRKGRQADSRFDPRYDHQHDEGGGVPLPSFAPLPEYAHGDDMSHDGSSVSGSVYSSQSRWSRGGGYYPSNDVRSQADSASYTSSRY